jgi:hypothetical protein
MHTIEIDFDVFKEITIRRNSEDVTANDVLREVFGLEPKKETPPAIQAGKPWVAKGVVFPQGTEFRAAYKGRIYYGKSEGGFFVLDGKKFSSPSAAAISITKNSVNGWKFWECKFPGRQNWQLIITLRKG